MSNVTEVIRQYGNGEITLEEANTKLKEMGSNIHLNPNKTGNALIDDGLGGELCTVEDGKVVGGNISETYTIFYDGKEWHTDPSDHATLIEGPGTPLTINKHDKKPVKPDMSRDISKANTQEIEYTAYGAFKKTYDENGYCVSAVKVQG